MDWISTKDSLPTHMQDVIFKGKFPFKCIGFFEKTENGYTFFHKSNEKKIYHIYGVTHWMPIPKPPLEDSKD